ncbi:hypothetical protein D3C84_1274940 [compost metagenome]
MPRSFPTRANHNQWSPKALKEYVGWRNVHTALRYVNPGESFGDWRRDERSKSK